MIASLNRIRTWFDRPYPRIHDNWVKLMLTCFIALVSFLILVIFKPFGLHQVEDITFFAGYGANAFIALFCHYFVLPKLLPRYFDYDQWTVGREYIFYISVLVMISILNYFYNSTIGLEISPQYGFLPFLFMTTAVGALPTLLMLYITERVAKRNNEEKAESANKQMMENQRVEQEDNLLTITSKNKSEQDLTIKSSHFLLAKSESNYVEIYCVEDQGVRKQLVRQTLSQLQSQLLGHTNIIRCHKSYMINRSNVSKIEGNARSCVAIMNTGGLSVPISRTFDRSLLTKSPSHTSQMLTA